MMVVMQPTKKLSHYQSIGLKFLEENGIISLLNNSGLRYDETRRQTDLDEMCIAVGLTIEKVKDETTTNQS